MRGVNYFRRSDLIGRRRWHQAETAHEKRAPTGLSSARAYHQDEPDRLRISGDADFDQFERLVEASVGEPQAQLVVLLGGEAGLRCGEMIGLEWKDVDADKRQLCVARSEWCGHVSVPKGGRIRYLPLTRRLAGALKSARHLRGPRVLCDATGRPLTRKMIQVLIRRAARRANVRPGVHILRHTFCSHLAMRGAPARAIQELAGHQDLGTTQRYMHLSPAALDAAIRLLEDPLGDRTQSRGEIVEAQGTRG